MNSVGFFEALWLYIWGVIKQSGIYKLLKKTYDSMSCSWHRSKIMDLFRKRLFAKDVLCKSVAGKIIRLPFTVLDKIKAVWGEKIRKKAEESLIVSSCKKYLEGFLAINVRFVGVIFLCLGMGLILGSFISGREVGVLDGALLFTGLLFIPFNIDVSKWLAESIFVKLFCSCFGIETDFNWYKENNVGRQSLFAGAIFGIVCGFMGGIVSPLIGIIATVAIAGIIAIIDMPKIGMFLIVFSAPLLPTMVMAGLSVLTLFGVVIKSVTDEDFSWNYDGTSFLMIGFIVIYLFAGITSFAPVKSLSIWAIYFAFMGAYFIIINLVKSKKDINNILTVFSISGLLVCLYGLAQYVFGWDTTQAWMDEEMFEDIKMRIYSTLENPNVLGEYILLVLPVTIGLMWTRKSLLQKVVYGCSAVAMFLALILTFSRGCWLGLIGAAVVFITFAAGKLWGFALIGLPVLPMVLPDSIIDRFTSIGNMEDSSTSYRVYIWMGTLAMIKDFWISGIGMGTEAFTEVYPFYSYSGISAPHSHNLFLQIWVESGVCGILVFLLLLFLFIKNMSIGFKSGGGKGQALPTLICAATAGVFGFLLQGMFDNCFYNYRVMLVFWCVIGIAMAMYNCVSKGVLGTKEEKI